MFHLLWPLIVEQLLAVTMGAVDTLMVSPVGEHAVSGVNVVDNINNFLIIGFIALCTGGAVVSSQYVGRGDHKNAAFASKQLVYLVTVISVVICVFAVLFRSQVVTFFYGDLDDDVMGSAMTYFFIIALSYPMLGIYNACAALFRSAGNSQIPMQVSVVRNILHIGGNFLFVHGLGMGVAGVALSALIVRTAAGLILLVMLIRDKKIPVTLSGIFSTRFDLAMTKRILNMGVPAGLENSMFQFGRLLTQRIFPTFGTPVIAANAVAGIINSFSFMIGNGYSVAILTVVGQCIGAGDYEAAKGNTKKLILLTWFTLALISGLTLIFRVPLISLFNLSPEAIETADHFIRIHGISMILGWTISFAFPAALRAAGDARYVMVVGTLSMWIVRVSFAYLLTFTFGLGPIGVWLAMGGDFMVRGLCFFLRWRGGRWQNIKVIDTKE